MLNTWRRFTINILQGETNKGSLLKDDGAFALLTIIFPHTAAMFNEKKNLLGLDTILNGEPIGLGNRSS
jgi:hypothetical protein